MTKRRVYSFNSELYKVTGVQKVLLDIHHVVQDNYEAKIVGLKPYSQVNANLNITLQEYVQWKNPFLFYNSIVILHERKFLLLFWILNHLLLQRIKIVYVHHNMLYGHKLASIMPKTIVCISDRGRDNLIEEYGAKTERIHKIHNCVKDRHDLERKPRKTNGRIRVLYPARINSTKRQIEVVEQLKEKIDNRIQIDFAGVGPLYEELKKVIKDSDQFHAIGFVEDVPALMLEYDYVMLYSKHEGLPISLIEAAMTGTPIICNDVGGNCEICHNGENGIIVSDWDSLIKTLNGLADLPTGKHEKMSNASRSVYEDLFTFEKFSREYLQLIKNLKK